MSIRQQRSARDRRITTRTNAAIVPPIRWEISGYGGNVLFVTFPDGLSDVSISGEPQIKRIATNEYATALVTSDTTAELTFSTAIAGGERFDSDAYPLNWRNQWGGMLAYQRAYTETPDTPVPLVTQEPWTISFWSGSDVTLSLPRSDWQNLQLPFQGMYNGSTAVYAVSWDVIGGALRLTFPTPSTIGETISFAATGLRASLPGLWTLADGSEMLV